MRLLEPLGWWVSSRADRSCARLQVHWSQWTVAQFDRTFRGTSHQIAIVFRFNGDDVHIVDISESLDVPDHIENNTGSIPGTALYDKKTKAVFVRCADGWASCTAFHFPTKKVLTAEAFANGYGIRKGGGLFQDG
jgi:methionyl-tRNA formyltransferase